VAARREGGEQIRDRINVGGFQRAGFGHAAQQCGLGKLAHPHSPLDGHAAAADAGRVHAADDRDRVKVDLWREPPVEAHFVGAGLAPLRERREI